nr:hypothetical protein GCM10020092_093700 [Actinoplanes digitatis]
MPEATRRSQRRLAEERIILSSAARPRRLTPGSRSITSRAFSWDEESRGVIRSRAASHAASNAGAASSTAAARIGSGSADPWCSAMVQQRLPVMGTLSRW